MLCGCTYVLYSVSPCGYGYHKYGVHIILVSSCVRYLLSHSTHFTFDFHMNLLVTNSLNLLAFPSTKSSPLFDTCENRSILALVAKGGLPWFPDTQAGGAIIPRFCPARKTTWSTKRLRSGRCRNNSQLFNLFVSCIFGCIHQMQESRCTARLGHANAVFKSKNEETNA